MLLFFLFFKGKSLVLHFKSIPSPQQQQHQQPKKKKNH